MKRILTLLSFSIFGLSSGFAQGTLQLYPCPVDVSGDYWTLKKAESDLSNLSNVSADLAWERTFVDMPEGWSTAVCDPNQCYAPFADEPLGPGAVLETFEVGPLETIPGSTFYVQFQPAGIAGNGTVRLNVYEVANPANSVLCEFRFEAVATSTGTVAVAPIAFHPNPVRDRIRVSTPAERAVTRVEIYSLVGKVIRHVDLGSAQTRFDLDVSDLGEGMYFARLMDGEGNLVTSKRFSKVQ
jgi:hypothetical protein